MGDAFQGAIGLIVGGVVLLVFASALGSVEFIDIEFWGMTYVFVGVILVIIVIAAGIGTVLNKV